MNSQLLKPDADLGGSYVVDMADLHHSYLRLRKFRQLGAYIDWFGMGPICFHKKRQLGWQTLRNSMSGRLSAQNIPSRSNHFFVQNLVKIHSFSY